ncbi:MAG: HIT domain-containing protein [Burkholderiaceae bacterium]
MTLRQCISFVAVFLLGIATGGYLFSKSLPRSFLTIDSCGSRCYKAKELLGLMASAGIQRTPGLLPEVVLESNECIAIQNPFPKARVHYVLFPKRDIKNIAAITQEDEPYVMGCLAMIRVLVKRADTQEYRVLSNGPGYQDIGYLHFHVIGK